MEDLSIRYRDFPAILGAETRGPEALAADAPSFLEHMPGISDAGSSFQSKHGRQIPYGPMGISMGKSSEDFPAILFPEATLQFEPGG